MAVFIGVALVCVWLMVLAVRADLDEVCADNTIAETNKSVLTTKWNSLLPSSRFSLALIGCMIISALLVMYLSYWPTLGIASIKGLLPSAKNMGVWILVLPTSLVGAVIFMFPVVKTSVLYQKIVWWFFPSCVTYRFLTYPFGGADASGMGSLIGVLGFVPVFLISLGFSYIVVTDICLLCVNLYVRRKGCVK